MKNLIDIAYYATPSYMFNYNTLATAALTLKDKWLPFLFQ